MSQEVDLQRVTAAPEMFTSEDGREFMVYPLSFRDWGTIEGWMREKIIAAAMGAVRDPSLTDDQKALVIREVTKEASRINMRSPEAREGLMDSLEGMFRITYLSLRKGNPKLTLDALEEMLGLDMMLLKALGQKAFALSFPQMKAFMEAMEKKQEADEAAKEAKFPPASKPDESANA